MGAEEPGDVTLLLKQWGAGDTSVVDPLFGLMYPELHRIAQAMFRGERRPGGLQPTSLVNEFYLKLVVQRRLQFEDRGHFLSLAARLMRRLMIDHVRASQAVKRSDLLSVPLHDDLAWVDANSPEMLDLDAALNELEKLDQRKCRMVELRYFLGFTIEETAELLARSTATVEREIRFARTWLFERLRPATS